MASTSRYSYVQLLENWGLASFIDAFQEEGIDDDSFLLLDELTVGALFKKMGPRLLFKKKYSEYLQECQQSSSTIQTLVSETFSSASTDTLSSDYSSASQEDFIFEADEELSNLFKIPVVPPAKRALEEKTIPEASSSTKRIKEISDCPSLLDLNELLRKTAEGQLVLANKDKLNNDLRQKIAKIVVGSLLDTCALQESKLEIKTDQFKHAATSIAKFFPGENSDTYFIPYSSGKGGLCRRPASGKLWARYINLKAALRYANAGKATATAEQQEEPELQELNETKLLFLKTAVEPYEKILHYWEETLEVRKKLYKKKELDDIYADFKCLSLNCGIELLESDFNQENDDKINIIYKEWPAVSQAIELEAKERKLELKDLKIEDLSTRALIILPLLFSPITIKNSKKGGIWRPSRVEVQQSFFLVVEDFAEIDLVVQRRRDKLNSYNLPLQPFGGIITEGNQAKAFYIVINENVKYTCDSSIRCLELLYKAYHSLNLEYPHESKHVWNFIQEMVFKTKVTSKISSTACVMADITFHMQKLS